MCGKVNLGRFLYSFFSSRRTREAVCLILLVGLGTNYFLFANFFVWDGRYLMAMKDKTVNYRSERDRDERIVNMRLIYHQFP